MPIHYLILREEGEENRYSSGDLAKILADIRSLYLSGAALFSKQTLRDVRQQFSKLDGKGGKVYVEGLDGNPVHFKIQPGWTLPSRPNHPEETLA
jgi:hypothetical protein